MKNILLTALVLGTSIFSMAQQAQPFHSLVSTQTITQKKQRNIPNWKPSQEKDSYWNSQNVVWDLYNTNQYIYVDMLLSQSTMQYEPSIGATNQRSTYTYNSAGQKVEELIESWDGVNWTSLAKYITLYSASGIETGYENYNWIGNNWELTDGQRRVDTYTGPLISNAALQTYNYSEFSWNSYSDYTYTYTPGGEIDQIVQRSIVDTTNILTNTARYRFVYSSFNIDSLAIATWSNSVWVENQRAYDMVWSNPSTIMLLENTPKDFTVEYFDGIFWGPDSRQTTSMSGLNSLILQEQYINSSWVPYSRTTKSYDSNNNQTIDEYELYANSIWNIDYMTTFDNTYDSDQRLIEIVSKIWNNTTLEMQNSYKQEFLDFVDVAGIDAANSTSLSVFPNPTSGSIQVRGMGNSFTYQLLDLSGRVIANQSSVSSTISCEGIQPGMYVLRVQSGDKSATSTVVIH